MQYKSNQSEKVIQSKAYSRGNFQDGGHCKSLDESLSHLNSGFNQHNTGIHLAWVVDNLVECNTNPKHRELGHGSSANRSNCL